MKYLILIGDGMGDYPLDVLNGKTPLQVAKIPNLDFLAQNGWLGEAKTIPDGMPPGSDVAIMSLAGYYPKGLITGRAPLEAASLGLTLAKDELSFRLNLVNLSFKDGKIIMCDHAAGHISSEEAAVLINDLNEKLPLKDGQRLFAGVSYRHLFLWPGFLNEKIPSYPPHDYRDQDVSELINEEEMAPLSSLILESWKILAQHPINIKRRQKGLPEANSIWLWSHGYPPEVKTYQERFNLSGVVVSAVDLVKGIGIYAGLKAIDVAGATGWLDTNHLGKVEAALTGLIENDFALLHLEAPDEAGHQGDYQAKIKAIEDFDAKIVGPILKALKKMGDFKMLIACDHFTPISLKTHSREAVPFVIYPPPQGKRASGFCYDEVSAKKTKVLLDPGASLVDYLFKQ